jgi:hypothetical protein
MRHWRVTHRLAGLARKKMNARSYLHTYMKRGKIIKGPCEECGSTVNVHGHHEDYDQPLFVKWLCKPCHIAHHKKDD